MCFAIIKIVALRNGDLLITKIDFHYNFYNKIKVQSIELCFKTSI